MCGIVGNPVKHSLSPAMHNAAYRALNIPFFYTSWKTDNISDAVKKMRNEDIRGYSVTIPHKISVIEYLDEVDETAKNIGAVNTVINTNGHLKGYNTDWQGCVKAIEDVSTIAGKKVVILGAGGAARAVVFGMKNADCRELVILNRTLEKAKNLAKVVGGRAGRLDSAKVFQNADILINTTSVGMSPKTSESPIDISFLKANLIVHDIVYNPKKTLLIKAAKNIGAKVVTGDRMLLYQAVIQFEMFTGEKAPVGVMEKVLENEL